MLIEQLMISGEYRFIGKATYILENGRSFDIVLINDGGFGDPKENSVPCYCSWCEK